VWLFAAVLLSLACSGGSGVSDAQGPEIEVAVDAADTGWDEAGADADGWSKPDGEAASDGADADLPKTPDTPASEPTAGEATADADGSDTPAAPHDAEPEADSPAPSDDVAPPDLGEAASLDAYEPECTADADCADDDPCTVDTCTAGACVRVVAADASPCDNGDPCTAGDTCVGGACVAGAPVGCDDGNACTTDQCGPGAGCSHWPRTGTACDDGDPCTGGDACLDGACQAGALNACPVCPDAACSAPYETCADCPADCGACVEDCAAPGDEDLDGLADCADPECASSAACLPAACLGYLPLGCGDSLWGNPGVDHLSGYDACSNTAGGDGEDDIYAVTLPPGTTQVAVTLDIDDTGGILTDGDDLDVYVLKGACAASACVAAATSSSYTETVSASGAPGDVFYVVVELYSLGFWGYGDYTISLDCY